MKIQYLIIKIINRENKCYVHEATLFGDNSPESIKMEEIAFMQRQKHMKQGEIAQVIIGNWIGWQDLGVGHYTGLDCLKKDNSIIIEIKNKYNTCNSGSQKAMCDKLANYKSNNPNTRCIWGIVNSKSGNNNLHEKFIHDEREIEKIQGQELLKMVFKIGNINYSNIIINFVKPMLKKIYDCHNCKYYICS
jgi:hypothetical protein